MRPAAIIVVLVAAFLVLFFPHYPVQWAGYTAGLVTIVSFAYSRTIRRRLRLYRSDRVLRIYQHQAATVEIAVVNASRLPIPFLIVSDNPGSLYAGYNNARLMSLRPGEKRYLRYRLKGHNRGGYRLGPLSVRYADPLGLFPTADTVRDEGRLVVYPRIYPVSFPLTTGLPAGVLRTPVRIYEDATRFRSVREYVPGDEPRRINWKVSARIGSLHSTEWLPTINTPVVVLLNLTASDYQQRNRYAHTERTIDAAASVVHHFAELGQEVGLFSTGLFSDGEEPVMPWIPGRGGVHTATSILEVLAQIRINEEPVDPVEAFLGAARISYGTRVFYLGAALREESLSLLVQRVSDASRLRLCYTDERVLTGTVTPSGLPLWRITDYGEKLFDQKA